MVPRALAAADILAMEGIEAEVIDLQSLARIDLPAILERVQRTSRLLTVEEQSVSGGRGGIEGRGPAAVGAQVVMGRSVAGETVLAEVKRVSMRDGVQPMRDHKRGFAGAQMVHRLADGQFGF